MNMLTVLFLALFGVAVSQLTLFDIPPQLQQACEENITTLCQNVCKERLIESCYCNKSPFEMQLKCGVASLPTTSASHQLTDLFSMFQMSLLGIVLTILLNLVFKK